MLTEIQRSQGHRVRNKTLTMVCGAAIAGSLFLPWIDAGPLGTVAPWSFLKDTDWSQLSAQPVPVLVFLATFALGALSAVLALVGWAPRPLSLVTGLLPWGLAAWVWFKAADQLRSLGLPVPDTADLMGAVQDTAQIASFGIYLWFGGAALLLVVSLLDPGDVY